MGRDKWFNLLSLIPIGFALLVAVQSFIQRYPGTDTHSSVSQMFSPLVAPRQRCLWLFNGAVFYVLLFATGQWRHIVPTSWDVFPNAASMAIQYLSLDWPTDNGRVAYKGPDYSDIGSGYGGYSEDHKYFGRHQTL